MPKASLVSVVEDDQFFRESMRRLMRSFGYTVEAFPSAADFLASPRLVETGCLIADVDMPRMTGLELHRHLIEMRACDSDDPRDGLPRYRRPDARSEGWGRLLPSQTRGRESSHALSSCGAPLW